MARGWAVDPAPLALCHWTALLLVLLLLSLSVHQAVSTHSVTGTPPSFTQEPQDMVVFALDAAGNNASLSLQCIAAGDPPPNITWFREGQPPTNGVVMEDGSLFIENITEGMDATRGGLSYHCTANNTFGTIRSRAANVSYAYFNGFDGPSGIEMVNVTTDRNGDVALECRVRDANPPPRIQWFDGNDMPLTEVRTNNRIRFLDNGRYLLIGALQQADVDTNYYCNVTNVRLHETRRSPTTYDLAPVLGAGEFMIYKRFVDRTIILMGGGTAAVGVDLSYIAGATEGVAGFGLVDCVRTGNTLNTALDLTPLGGVVDETIPRMGDDIPSEAESLTFEVECDLVGNGQIITSRATLTVLVSPQITMQPMNDLEQLVGGSVTFTCGTSGIPTPDVTWYFNGMQLTASGVISISGNILSISPLAEAHTGMYQCFVSNMVNTSQTSWALQVRTPVMPNVVVSLSDGVAEDDYLGPLLVLPSGEETITLFAVVTADPCPTIQWSQNGIDITQNEVYTINDPCPPPGSPGITPYNFTLTINVTNETAGAYTAAVTNPAGTILVSSVMVTPPVPVEVTALQLPSSPPCLLNGTSVIIRCINNGFPRPDITFSRGTLDITPGMAPFGHFQQLRFDTLNLTMVQREDEAEYVCRASRGGTELARSPSLRLEFCTLPTIVRLDMPMAPTEGTMFQLTCSFSAIPSPMIRWEREGELFLLGEGRRIINSTVTDGMGQSQLEISSLVLGDRGVYTCMVSNSAGMATMSVRLEVRERPPAPLLTTEAIIGIAVGGVGGILLIVLVILLLCCVYFCARRGKEETMIVTTSKMGYDNDFTDARGNVDRDSDEEEGQPEAFNPQYESLPALRPAQPPQYKPTPNYPHGAPLTADDVEMTKVPPPDTDSTHFSEFMSTPYGKQDNGSAGLEYHRPTVDDFLSEDAQFV